MTAQTAQEPQDIAAIVTKEVERTITRAQRGIDVLLNRDEPETGKTPRDVIYRRGTMELYHYHPMSDEVYRVPVVLVTGDDVAVKQVSAVATDAKTVAVKRAINPRAVELRPLDEVHADITAAAQEGVKAARRFTPKRESAYQVDVRFRETFIPEVAENLTGMQRPSPDTIAFTTDSMPRAYTLIRLLYRYINPD